MNACILSSGILLLLRGNDKLGDRGRRGPMAEVSRGVPRGFTDRLYNEDLAPAKERKWGTYSLFALWMSDVHNLGNYTFAAGLFVLGLSAWEVLVSLAVGFTIVFIGMNFMGFAGQRTGVPFPVFSRLSFGIWGANIPALIRAIIAIAWYGIQTYLAALAINVLLLELSPGLASLEESSFLGLSYLGWISFISLWFVQLIILTRGIETVRKYQDWAGPIIWIVMLLMAIWLLIQAGGISFTHNLKELSTRETIRAMGIGATLTVATYVTLMLNFCDFSRFTPTRRAIVAGNFLGLPINGTAFAVVSVLTTAGALEVYGETITDPAYILAKVPIPLLLIVGAILFATATIGVNIVANFVSPAYDLANVWPKHINFQRGGMISAFVAVAVLPWNLYSNPVVINYFLGGLGAILGPLFGIMMTDYYFVRRGRVVIDDLFRDSTSGAYYYRRGLNPRALWVFIPTALVSAVIALWPPLATVAPFALFIGGAVAAVIYYFVMRDHPSLSIAGATEPQPDPALTAEPESEDVEGEHRALFGEEPDRPRFSGDTEEPRRDEE
jgi:NCS1 family nucleobase:cation symporter-1